MRETWEAAEKSIKAFKQELEELHELLPNNVRIHKKTASLNRAWKKVQFSLNQMDQYITPLKSIEVKSNMLDNQDFHETWKMWKEYLNEQHGIFMKSRAELMALKQMKKISENNPASAIYFLEYAMSRLDRYFYRVIEKDDKNSKFKSTTPTIYKLPPQYKTQLTDPLEGLTN